MKRTLVTALAVWMLVACRPRIEVPPPPESGPLQGLTGRPLPINIGDVEAQLHLYCDIPAGFEQLEQVDVMRMHTRKYDPGMITIECYPPYPTALTVTCNMNNRMTLKAGVIAMRGSINVDESPVRSFVTFVDKDTAREMILVQADVLAGLAEPPDTMLVNATATVVLLPDGTDITTVDLQAVQGTPETQSVLLSNPIRINFLPAKETP